MKNIEQIEFVGFDEKEEVKEEVASLILLTNPGDAQLEVRKIGEDYHVSPKKDSVGYGLNTNKKVLALEIKTGISGKQIRVAGRKRTYYLYQFPLPAKKFINLLSP